jgi:hypothetical protein
MKTIIGFCAIMLLICNQLFSQNEKSLNNSHVNGLYLSISDFEKNILTCKNNKQEKGEKINLNQFFISPKIECTEQGKVTVFLKDSIFAIHMINGENYRFINHSPCLIADTSCLFIYTQETTKTEYYMSGPHRREKEIPVTYYYFSFGNHKSIYLLTSDNLRKYVLAGLLLQNSFNDNFTTDEMLTDINQQTGHFKINEMLISATKN